jgi:hypothetical protein
MKHLRQVVVSQMIARHKIPSELARYHVERMDAEELWWRFRYYKTHSGVELSAAGPKTERSTSVLPGSDARNDDGRLAVLYCIPEHCPHCDYPLDPYDREHGVCPRCGHEIEAPESARFGKRATGSEGRGVFCPGVLPESEVENRGMSGGQKCSSGEGSFSF